MTDGGHADPAYRDLQRPRRRKQKFRADEIRGDGHPAMFQSPAGARVVATDRGGGRKYHCPCGWEGWSAWGHARRHAETCPAAGATP